MKNKRLHCLLLCIALLLPASVKAAQTSTKKNRFVKIPVFYLTDRAMKKNTFSGDRRYAINCKHDMYYGTANFVVRNFEDKQAGDDFSQLSWEAEGKPGPKVSQKDEIDPADPQKARKVFFDRLAAALEKSKDNELCIFIHGAEEGFEDAVEDAADLEYYLEHPVVLYSWPSESKLIGYSVDNGNCEWSEAHFSMFLHALEDFKKEHPVRIVMISHSMGNRMVIRAIPKLRKYAVVDDFEMVSPDMDLETCKHYLRAFPKDHPMVRLYTSTRDKMLVLSQMMFGGYYRLGEGPIGSINGHNPSAGTSDPSKSGATDVLEAASLKDKHFERIDFTTVDRGFEGHTIPFELIANMLRNNEPGPGLTLIEAQPRISALAKFENRVHHLDDDSEGPEEGYELLVVRVKGNKDKSPRKEASKSSSWKATQH